MAEKQKRPWTVAVPLTKAQVKDVTEAAKAERRSIGGQVAQWIEAGLASREHCKGK